ncbi:phosphoribosylglycinamide formyltransferase [Sanguibacter suaedae]|uniref:Phosphoribosylglycinamide formyltransferase n=1 Tax=Sanguibacter suaedae TaxID=2795737 RepID=A0A934I6L9_9MICO|nr:phosphoribosylglycinamide formyltransferase [Sanguibacter suaedae]MBI9114152.1 phosphoribosylglycinamide formyltransferase [Sanguibacter suaedae]
MTTPPAPGPGHRPSPEGRGAPRTPSGHEVPVLGDAQAARVVVLASGGGSTLAALLDAHLDPAFGARVVAVVSDVPDAGALERARDAGVACAVVEPKDFGSRAEWDAALAETVAVFHADWVVSAGFMRILGAAFLDRFGGRTLNTHPALLPAFPGAHGVRDALAYGVRVTGCTLHVVDAGTDTGPVVAQVAVPVEDGDDESTLHERIKVAERDLLVEWVGRVARGGLTVDGRHVVVGGGGPTGPTG